MDTVSHGMMGCQVWTKPAPEEAAVSNSNVQQVAALRRRGCLLCVAPRNLGGGGGGGMLWWGRGGGNPTKITRKSQVDGRGSIKQAANSVPSW